MSPAKKRRLGIVSTLDVILVSIIAVLVNLISSQYFSRLDFTENKIYSLSVSSRTILSSLPDTTVRIRVFFDEKLPPEYANQRRYLEDLLRDMVIASRGKLRADFADMKKPEAQDEARQAGIPPLRFTAVRKDKFEVQEGMMGLAMYYGDKKEIIAAITEARNLEYELLSRVVKLIRVSKPSVGWTADHGEQAPPEELMEYVSQHYELKRIERMDSDPVERISAFIVAGPRRPFSDTVLRALDQAILRGIPTAILVDLYDVQMGNFFVRKNDVGLSRLLKSYGLEMREGLIVDRQNVPVQIQSQQGFFTVQSIVHYAYIPRVTDLSKDHAATRSLPEIAMPFVSPIQVLDSSGVTILARSSPESFRMAQVFMVAPTEEVHIEGAEQGPFVLGVSIQGTRSSAFADTPDISAKSAAGRLREGNVRLVVMANSNFMDEGHGGGGNNLTFMANLVDWLASSEDLISIRSKANIFRPLRNLSDETRNMIKLSNIFLMPLAIALSGVVRWQTRRMRRRRWEETVS